MGKQTCLVFLLLLTAALAGCASAPRTGVLQQDEPRQAVRRTVDHRSAQIFVIEHDGAVYRFEREIFNRRASGQLDTFWFVYRDDRLYTVIPEKGFPDAMDAPPCTAEDQQRWSMLAESARARDLAHFDFDDPALLSPQEPNTHPELAVALMAGVALYVPPLMEVSVAFGLGATLPDAFIDLPARRYADDPEFGISKQDLEAKIGKSWRDPWQQGRCEFDYYGGRVLGQYWVQYVYLDGHLFALQRQGP